MILDVKGISKKYTNPEGVLISRVFENLEFSLKKVSTTAIVGPSGCGKTTLLNILGTLETPDQGEVLFDGKSILTLSTQEKARYRNTSLGFVFQQHHLLSALSVLENVLVPTLAGFAQESKADSLAHGKRLLDALNLGNRLHSSVSELSGGERQRVAVARAFIMHPKLILADEPTGALDVESSRQLADLLLTLAQEEKTTLVTVTHSQELAQRMEQIWKLNPDGLENLRS